MVLFNAQLTVNKTSKKVYEIESEMDENDFVMKLVSGDFVNGISWIGVWVGSAVVMLVAIRLFVRPTGTIITDIALYLIYVMIFLIFIWLVWLILMSRRQKIVVKDDTITHYKSQRKIAEISFDEISKAKNGMSKDRVYMNFYGMDDEIIFTFYDNWIGEGVLLRRLILSGKTPFFRIPPHLKNAPIKNEEEIEKRLNDLTTLMNFLIEEDLTTWYSFNENGLVEIDFELYYHDLTAKGQRLFTPNVINKLVNPSPDDEEISEISDFILILRTDLTKINGNQL